MFTCLRWYSLVFQDPDFHVPKGFTNIWSIAASACKINLRERSQECSLKKEQSYQNNNNNYLQKSYTEKKSRHEPSGWAMFTRCLFDKKENQLNYCRGKDHPEQLCKRLKEHAMKTINYEEKEMIPLTYEENKSYKEQKIKSYIRRKVLYG